MYEKYPPLDLLQVYRSLAVRPVQPTAKTLYSGLVKRDVDPTEFAAVVGRVIQSATKRYDAWQLADALEELDLVLRDDPGQAGALHLKADILARFGGQEEARNLTRALIARNPMDVKAIRRLKALGLPTEIHASIAEAEVVAKNHTAKAYVRAAQYLNEGGLSAAAERFALEGMKQKPDPETLAKLTYEQGLAFANAGQHQKALKVFATVPKSSLTYRRSVVHMWSRCLLELGFPTQAEALLKEIGAHETGKTSFHGTVFAARLQRGNIKKAHQMYRWRATSLALARYFRMPQYPRTIDLRSGAHKNQDAMIVVEGGPGDEIRLASMYGELSQLCNSLTASCDPRLQTLLERSFPDVSFIPTQRYRKEFLSTDIEGRSLLTDKALYPCVSDAIIAAGRSKDLVCSSLDVLMDLRGERDDFRVASRLTPDPEICEQWRRKFADRRGRKQVGLSWRSLLMSRDRSRHYLTAEDLLPLKDLANVDFWLLQAQVADEELDLFAKSGLRIEIPDIDLKDDFEHQAALIANLDCVVSPLATMAELSGMMGTRTLIFCRTNEVIWRKNDDGSDVWYENGRLVTGDPITDVPTLVDRIVMELSGLPPRL